MALERSKPLRRTPLKRGTSQMKRTPLARSPMKRSSRAPAGAGEPKARRKPSKPDPLTSEIREAVAARSGGWCEVGASPQCHRTAVHVHHRKLRRADDHRVINLLHLCTPCHDAIHRGGRASYERGLLVSQYADPAAVPVVVGRLC